MSGVTEPVVVRSVAASGTGAGVYETEQAVHEYLQFHYGQESPEFVCTNSIVPPGALRFVERIVEVCEKHGRPDRRRAALDIGCSVGGMSFGLSRHFETVCGIDFSNAFVAAAEAMKQHGEAPYNRRISGDIFETSVATLPKGCQSERCTFVQGDACALGDCATIAGQKFDCVLAANLLCRLPDPKAFLAKTAEIMEPEGVFVLISPYSWLAEYTEKERWLGGTRDASGAVLDSSEAVLSLLEPNFVREDCFEMPFLIREHARKFQLGISECTVWRRK